MSSYAPTIVPTADEVQADFTSSFWLKNALTALQKRDPLDAARDASLLAAIMAARCDAMDNRNPTQLEQPQAGLHDATQIGREVFEAIEAGSGPMVLAAILATAPGGTTAADIASGMMAQMRSFTTALIKSTNKKFGPDRHQP